MQAILAAVSIEDEEIREIALQNLAEVPSIGYGFLDSYIEKIGEITMMLLQSKNFEHIN